MLVALSCVSRPDVVTHRDYLTSESCAPCHPREYAAWKGSHHERAMQSATDSVVLGSFKGDTLRVHGVTTRFQRRGGAFFVTTEGADGKLANFEVRATFGVDPLQQYLVEGPGGRLQALPFAWDVRGRRWFALFADEPIRPGDPLHWTGASATWNAQCAACHSTRVRKRHDVATDRYDTRWTERNVGCEACHGAGARHAASARSGWPSVRTRAVAGLRVPMANHRMPGELDVCAPCHARRRPITDAHEPGDPFLDHYVPVLLEEGYYHADGQILDEVYEYGSFVQSRMHAAGVRCSDCHDPHSGRLRAGGNDLCTRCHSDRPNRAFPALRPKRYDTPDHHFHEPGTAGASCVACHMPSRTYMRVDVRHDHGFRVPRPEPSRAAGAPHACEACHAKSAPWAANAILRHRGDPTTESASATLLPSADATRAEEILAGIAGDSSRAPIVRASALDRLFSNPTAAIVGALLLEDRDPLVRRAAVRSQEAMDARTRRERLTRRLSDPLRAVRIEAARVLADVTRETWSGTEARAFDRALAEYVTSQEIHRDAPTGHFNLARLHEARGDDLAAESGYRAALTRDPGNRPAAFNLVHVLVRRGRGAEAESLLRAGLEREPDDGERHYSLGLLLAEAGRLEEAAEALRRAAERLPDRARVHLNRGRALAALGLTRGARKSLLRARALDGSDPDVAAELVEVYLSEGNPALARREVERLRALAPDDPRARRLGEDASRR